MTLRVPLLPRWLRWLAVAGLAALIFYASILAVPPETVIDQTKPDLLPLDKWRHFLAYAAFGGALAYATTDWEVTPTVLAVGVIGITVVYGIGIEFGQSLVPGRYFSLGDAYANALGGVLVVPWYLLRPYLELVPISAWLGTLTAGD
ncbi:MAG: VanZ family protein [Haloarculaceae archaeon]